MSLDQRVLARNLYQALLVGLGVWLIIAGLQLSGLSGEATSSTKGGNATIGAAIGAGVGFGTYLVVGGIGVATGGIGFAVGAVALTALGLGAGALTGAATGETTIVQYSCPSWLGTMLILMGCAALYAAYRSLRAYEASAGRSAPVSREHSSLSVSRLPVSVRVPAILLVGVLAGSYASTLTERLPPPAPVLENVVFIDDGPFNRGMEHLRWAGRKKQITCEWSGHYLRAGEMNFREVDGKWQEQQPESE